MVTLTGNWTKTTIFFYLVTLTSTEKCLLTHNPQNLSGNLKMAKTNRFKSLVRSENDSSSQPAEPNLNSINHLLEIIDVVLELSRFSRHFSFWFTCWACWNRRWEMRREWCWLKFAGCKKQSVKTSIAVYGSKWIRCWGLNFNALIVIVIAVFCCRANG